MKRYEGRQRRTLLALMNDDVRFRSLAAGAAQMGFTRTSTCKDEVKRYLAELTS